MLTAESVLVPTHSLVLPPSLPPSYYFNAFFFLSKEYHILLPINIFSGSSMYPEELYDFFVKLVISLSF